MNLLDKIKNDADANELQADWTEGGPLCVRSLRMQHDGRRCQVLGFEPGLHCGPAVQLMVLALTRVPS